MKCLRMLTRIMYICACGMQLMVINAVAINQNRFLKQNRNKLLVMHTALKPAPAAPSCGAQMPKAANKK